MTNPPQKTVFVAFGNKLHGKDTVADMLIDNVHVEATHLSFADPVKEITSKFLGIPLKICYSAEKDTHEVYGKTVRKWLQIIGTDWAREQIHTDIWVHAFSRKVEKARTSLITCSDGRFNNEREAARDILEEAGYRVIMVKVLRPDQELNLDHPSESEVYEMPDNVFDRVIVNDGTLPELEEKVKGLIQEFMPDFYAG